LIAQRKTTIKKNCQCYKNKKGAIIDPFGEETELYQQHTLHMVLRYTKIISDKPSGYQNTIISIFKIET